PRPRRPTRPRSRIPARSSAPPGRARLRRGCPSRASLSGAPAGCSIAVAPVARATRAAAEAALTLRGWPRAAVAAPAAVAVASVHTRPSLAVSRRGGADADELLDRLAGDLWIVGQAQA